MITLSHSDEFEVRQNTTTYDVLIQYQIRNCPLVIDRFYLSNFELEFIEAEENFLRLKSDQDLIHKKLGLC